MNTAALGMSANNVEVSFGGLKAVDDISFDVPAGEMFGVIGPNGAGKTTLLNAISGLVPVRQGSIRIGDTATTGRRPDRITALGVGRTFQAAEVFNEFRVLEYMVLGNFCQQPKSLLAAALQLPNVRRAESRDRRSAIELLDRFGVADLRNETLKELPYGVRKLIDMLRAMVSGPQLLLLDEPTSGTAMEDRALLRRVLDEARSAAVTVVVVDHDVQFVTDVCDRLLVMNFGRELGIGTPADVLSRREVQRAYVGMEDEENPHDVEDLDGPASGADGTA